ncbi:MAG: cytochrome c [Bryobacteraceae bacterium]
MKKMLLAAGVLTAMLASMMWALDEKQVSTKMKSAGDHMGGLRKAMGAKDMAAVSTHAKGIADAMGGGVDAFWKGMGMEKAAEWQVASHKAANELAAAASANNADGVRSAMGALGGTCKQCHEAHREKLADGTYKIKK